jgi:hypothetical protein
MGSRRFDKYLQELSSSYDEDEEIIMTKKTAVLYHSDNDGFGAAYAAWTVYKDNAHYIPVQYGQPVPDIPDGVTELFIVDFSYDRETCDALSEKYQLVILDHHKTAEAALEGLPYAFFDLTKSGAVMAWEFFRPDELIPDILRYVQDYDLWKFELPSSKEINLAISALPWEFEAWDCASIPDLRMGGGFIKCFRDGQIRASLKSVRMMELVCDVGTFEVPVVNATANVSELGHELCRMYPDKPFSLSYCDRGDCRTWSLRSVGDFDVSAIAKSLGGGGHKNAAGFTTPLGWPGYISTDFKAGFDGGSE